MKIRLRSKVEVASRSLTLADIADVSSPSGVQQQLVRSLDLKAIPADQDTMTISRNYVAIRVQLAGWRQSELTIEGPSLVSVSFVPPKPLSDLDIERAASVMLKEEMAIDLQEIRVELQQPFMEGLQKSLHDDATLRVEVKPPQILRLGNTSLKVWLWRGDHPVLQRTVSFRVQRRHRVAVASTSLNRDDLLTRTAYRIENRFLDKRVDELTDDQLEVFLCASKRYGLNPIANQIYPQLRGNNMTITTGIDGYRLIADRTGKYAGNDDPVFDDEAQPRKATVTVYKIVGGQRCGFTATARWDQYFPGEKQGFMWKKMPHLVFPNGS